MATRTPDLRLTCMDAEGNKSGKLGAAWTNDDGSIHIKLDPGVQLHNGLKIMLWPVDQATEKPRQEPARGAALTSPKRPPGKAAKPRPSFDDMDDDLPF